MHILYLHQIPVATNNNSTIDEKKRGPGREEREHFKNLGDWFGPVDKVRIEKLIANIRNGRIPYEEDKRGYIKKLSHRWLRILFFFLSFFKIICIPSSKNSNLSKNDTKCHQYAKYCTIDINLFKKITFNMQ